MERKMKGKLTHEQEKSIQRIWTYADKHDKSTAWMLQRMADEAKCSMDDVIEYLHQFSVDSDTPTPHDASQEGGI